MAEELQALLERINKQGVEKAEAEAEKIISHARKTAETTVKNARDEAAEIIAAAKADAELLTEKGRKSLAQAARDTLLSLRAVLQARMHSLVQACAGEAISGKALAEIIAELVGQYASATDKDEHFNIQISAKEKADVEKYLLSALGADLQKRSTVTPVPHLEGGFRLDFSGKDVIYDFSDAALAEVLCEFVNPRLAEIIGSVVEEKKKKKG
jgi:V/A-type H+-transporting ATPase subunit E